MLRIKRLRAPCWTSAIGSGISFRARPHYKEYIMHLTVALGPLISLIAGILILIMPRLLNYIVAIYLIVIGLIGLFGPSLHL